MISGKAQIHVSILTYRFQEYNTIFRRDSLYYTSMEKQDMLITGCAVFILVVISYVGYTFYFANPQGETKGAATKPTPRIVRPSGFRVQPTTAKHILDKDKNLYNQMANDPKSTKFGLSDVIGSNTSGEGFYLRGGGKLYIGMKLNMPAPGEGQAVQAWLMKELPRKQYVPLGRPQIIGDGQYLVAKTITPSYPEFDTIVITLETEEDMTPERVIMQGKM